MTAAAASKAQEPAKSPDLPPPPTTDPMVAAVNKAHMERVEQNKLAAAKAAEEAKPTLHLLEALMSPAAGEAQVGETGAALFIAHMLVELGAKKVHAMKVEDFLVYANRWRTDHPMAWPAVKMGWTMKFVNVMTMHGTAHDTVDEYQVAMSKIAPAVRQVGF
jgi:hypothetical protein